MINRNEKMLLIRSGCKTRWLRQPMPNRSSLHDDTRKKASVVSKRASGQKLHL